MSVWNHRRKGRIEGEIVWEHGDWVRIRLTGEHHLRYMSEANRGRVHESGDQITLRRCLLTEGVA